MILLDVEKGTTFCVLRFEGGEWMENKLRRLGLLPSTQARVLRQAPWNGPVMIEVDGRTIAIGKDIASKIIVEEEAAR